MNGTLLSWTSICVAVFALWQAPALADCPDTALQSTADNFIAVSQPGADVSEILETVDALVVACATDPLVLKLAAMTYANSPSPDAVTTVDRLTTSLNLISRMWDNIDGFTAGSIIDQNGMKQVVGTTDLYEIEKRILNGLLQAEQISGVQSSYTHPPAGANASTGCRGMDRTDVSIASVWIQRRGDHPGAYSLMDSRIAKCEADLADPRYTAMLGLRARALLASIQRDPTQEDALEKAARAKADSERFVELNGGYEAAAWLKSDTLNLEQATETVRAGTAPQTLSPEMFVSPWLENPATQLTLALLLDKAWAKDAETGLASGYKSYREVLSKAFEMTRPLDDPAPARLMIFKAAEAHASGEVRGPGHESLEPPPDFLYKWIKPAGIE